MPNSIDVNSILIAIAHREVNPWKEIRRLGQEKTWVGRFRESGIRVIYYLSKEPTRFQYTIHTLREFNRFRGTLGLWQGRADKFLMKVVSFKEPEYSFFDSKNELHVSSPSTYFRMHERNYALFKWFMLKRTEHFLFRTNTSSYLNLTGINSYLGKIENPDDFLGGVLDNSGCPPFVSGAGILLPRKTVEKFLTNWNLLERHMIEDVALGRLAHRVGVPLQDLPRIDISGADRVSLWDLNALKNNFHFRCKGIIRPMDDIDIMEALDSIMS